MTDVPGCGGLRVAGRRSDGERERECVDVVRERWGIEEEREREL